MKIYARTLVAPFQRMSDDEIRRAFSGNQNTEWYRALVQVIWDDQHKERLNAAAEARANNALAMAAANGAYEALSGILNALANYVEPAD